jgi:hypothetical protein
MTQSGQDPPVAAAGAPPLRAGGDVETTAQALLEAAALAAAMRRVESWNPRLHLDAAAERAWASAGSGERGDWRMDPSRLTTSFRLAVLVAEAAISRCLVEDAYLNARQLSVDLRQGATWLGDGARFGVLRRGQWARVISVRFLQPWTMIL